MERALDRRKDGGKSSAASASIKAIRPGLLRPPDIVEMPRRPPIVREETFAPILYVITYDTLDEAIAHQQRRAARPLVRHLHHRLREAELFMSAAGSDCGIANVNIGTSGAEIGGAFGGEKQTGGGRESGSDAWKAYMRAPPTPSTTRRSCRWPRECSSAEESVLTEGISDMSTIGAYGDSQKAVIPGGSTR